MSEYYGTLIGTKGARESTATRCGTERVEAHCRTWVVGGRVLVARAGGRGPGFHVARFELTTGSNRWGANILVAEYAFTPEGGLIPRPAPQAHEVACAWSEQWLRYQKEGAR